MINKLIIFIILSFSLTGCGKVGPLVLPEEKINKSIITFPCDEECIENFEAEKARQQNVILNLN
tara:strand:+ start:277 stop:468 length:192 start_codon:yes stop_codon:yes gene_type:complete